MSGARTVWQDLETRRTGAMNRQRAGSALAVVLLCAMAAAQVLFVHVVAAPTQAAEAMPMME
jgi:hypothetical protein